MKSFKDFHKQKLEAVKDAIRELQNLKMYHDFQKPVTDDFLDVIAAPLKEVGIEPEDILASKGIDSKHQHRYLFVKSAPGCGMGHGALKDLEVIRQQLEH